MPHRRRVRREGWHSPGRPRHRHRSSGVLFGRGSFPAPVHRRVRGAGLARACPAGDPGVEEEEGMKPLFTSQERAERAKTFSERKEEFLRQVKKEVESYQRIQESQKAQPPKGPGSRQ